MIINSNISLRPTRAALLHLRIVFSFFLLPVFIFAVSQAPHVYPVKAFLAFLVWHFFIYPASNGYNSYFDKDEGSIALLENPPPADPSLYYLSLILDAAGIILGFWVSAGFAGAVLVYGVLSKLYSHPSVRLKKYPVVSFLIVFIFQGAFVYWSTYFAVSDTAFHVNKDLLTAGLICSCLIGASYPITQVYQHEEDARRGDRTLSLMLGIKGSFRFSALVFVIALVLMFFYWYNLSKLLNFVVFLIFIIPVVYRYAAWYLLVQKDERNAGYRNMIRTMYTSGIAMFAYFMLVWILG